MAKTKKRTRAPILGAAFEGDFRNAAGRCEGYAAELRYYKPRGFSKLARELEVIAARITRNASREDDGQAMCEAMDEADTLLTEWARRIERHDYIYFGHLSDGSGSVGFWIDTEAAREMADIVLDAGDCIPASFSGDALFINDHGNATLQRFSRGKRIRTLFEVV